MADQPLDTSTHMPYSLAGVIAALIAVLGLFALAVVAWRL